MSRHTGDFCVFYESDRVGAAGVLRDTRIREIHFVAFVIEYHIFQKRSEMERSENIRFGFFGKIDGFRIASTFDVKNTVFAPDVFVITDKPPLWISRKRCLTGTG